MTAMIAPPVGVTGEGRERLIGAEIEFANLDCRRAAEIVQRRFGGRLDQRGPHRFEVIDTVFGPFEIELDSRYVHPADAQGGESSGCANSFKRISDRIERKFYESLGDIGQLWLPVEIVTPPIPLPRFPEIDGIVVDLRGAGAEGTDDGLLFAFATQLNPEVPSTDDESILAHLKAFLLLSDWLRKDINLDIKRRLLPFIDPFPPTYVRRVVDPDYQPDRDRLIDDYLDANPTRNRELDLLPLFCHLDPGRVRRRLDDPRIKPRPTFHFRLPDTRLRDPAWGLVSEWNRWVRVEQLAADEERLRRTGADYLARDTGWLPGEWVDAVGRLFQ